MAAAWASADLTVVRDGWTVLVTGTVTDARDDDNCVYVKSKLVVDDYYDQDERTGDLCAGPGSRRDFELAALTRLRVPSRARRPRRVRRRPPGRQLRGGDSSPVPAERAVRPDLEDEIDRYMRMPLSEFLDARAVRCRGPSTGAATAAPIRPTNRATGTSGTPATATTSATATTAAARSRPPPPTRPVPTPTTASGPTSERVRPGRRTPALRGRGPHLLRRLPPGRRPFLLLLGQKAPRIRPQRAGRLQGVCTYRCICAAATRAWRTYPARRGTSDEEDARHVRPRQFGDLVGSGRQREPGLGGDRDGREQRCVERRRRYRWPPRRGARPPARSGTTQARRAGSR